MLTEIEINDIFDVTTKTIRRRIVRFKEELIMIIFQMKAKPHGHEKLNDFLKEGFVCIGWPEIGDLNQVDKDEIRTRLENAYDYKGHTLGYNLGQVNAFVNVMKKGDLVLIKDRDKVHVGTVGDYYYEKQYDNKVDGLCHRRNVEWQESVNFEDLQKDLQSFVKNRHTISQFSGTRQLEAFSDLFTVRDVIEKEDRERLDGLFSDALDILEAELKSEDPDRRLKAASELVRLKTQGGLRND